MKLSLLMKGMTGAMGPEEMLALFETLGVSIETREIPMEMKPVSDALESLARHASGGGKLVELTMRHKEGQQMKMVVAFPDSSQDAAEQKKVDNYAARVIKRLPA